MDGLKAGDPTDLGGYRLLGRLGSGPTGVVYLAVERDGAESRGQRFALKVLSDRLAVDEGLRSRLLRDSGRIKSVAGRHVARVRDIAVEDRSVLLVAEYVEGSTLEQLVANGRRIQGPLLWFIAEGLVDGLRAIHGAGIIHRNLKPANVFIGPEGVKIADFALGGPLDEGGFARPSAATGSSAWASPEQITGAPVDARTDIFNMGLILANLALGRHPYSDAGALADVSGRIAGGAPALDAVQSPMREMLARCLSADSAQRPMLGELGSFFASAGTNPSTQPIPIIQVSAAEAQTPEPTDDDSARSAVAVPPGQPFDDSDAGRFADTPPSLERIEPVGIERRDLVSRAPTGSVVGSQDVVDAAAAEPSEGSDVRGISDSRPYVIQDGFMNLGDDVDAGGFGQDGGAFGGEPTSRRRRKGGVVVAAGAAVLALVAAAGVVDAFNVVDLGLIGAADTATTTTTTSTTSTTTTTTVVATTTVPPVPVYRIYEVEGSKYRWNPCQNPIKILLNPEDKLTPGQLSALEGFLAAQAGELSGLTGMRIEYTGLTEEVSGRGYTFGEEILLHIAVPGEGILEDDKPFEGAVSSDRIKDGFREIDAVNFHYNANALQYLFLEDELHTYGQWLVMLMLGNALGLNPLSEADMTAAGSTDPEGWEKEIMFYGGRHLDTPVWGPGDRQGLVEVGAGAGCF